LGNASRAPAKDGTSGTAAQFYGEKYRAKLEKNSAGKFIAINVANGDASLADTGEDAIRLALEKDPSGFFHLMRVRHKAAFET